MKPDSRTLAFNTTKEAHEFTDDTARQRADFASMKLERVADNLWLAFIAVLTLGCAAAIILEVL